MGLATKIFLTLELPQQKNMDNILFFISPQNLKTQDPIQFPFLSFFEIKKLRIRE